MSNFGGRSVDHEDVEAQLKALGQIQRLLLQGIDPNTLNLVVSVDGDFILDTDGNLVKWS